MQEVVNIGADQVPPALTALDEQELKEALSLAINVTAYVLVEACGNQWPNPGSIRKISETLATKSSNARRLQLDPEVIHSYLSRTVFGKGRLEDVAPDEPAFTRLPVVVASEALAVYTKGYKSKWDYLDRAESGIEEASALDPMVIPGAVMRAYMQEAE
jgi:hypothetical protein